MAPRPRRLTTAQLASCVALWLTIGATVTIGIAWYAELREHWATTYAAIDSDPATWPDPVPASWSRPIGSSRETRWGVLVRRMSYSHPSYDMTTRAITMLGQGQLVHHEAGWPAAAVSGSMSRGTDIAGDHLNFLLRVPISAKAVLWLPLKPFWPGFILNTLFYAAIAWSLWQLPLTIRRHHRRRTGHCPRCGYNLAGLTPGSPCPECGRKL